MKGLSALLLAALAAPAFGQYSYYFTDPMQSLQTSYWTSSGSPVFTNSYGYWGGYASSSSTSMVSKVAVPDGTASYEVRATVHFPNGIGISTPPSLLLRSSSTFASNGLPTTAYIVQFNCASSGSTVSISKIVSNTVTLLTTSGITCSDGMTIRAAISDNGQIIPYVNDALVGWTQDTSITSGAPGIVLSSYIGSGIALITQVQLGPADRIAPGPIPTNGLTYSVYSNHIDFQWPAVPDDPNGTGVVLYQFLRNDQWAQNTTSLSWSDTTVQPGVEYSYTFIVLDYFFNPTSETVTITVPPLPGAPPTPPDGRRVGVRSTGAYWGASTEQIDVLSGNVNYTVPLLKAQGRTGWSVGFSLAYNSQNWRHDSGGIWNLGEDVGYGYGRKLLAGSLTPIWADQYTLYYYSFVDSTGAEYRLNQNSGGIWTSSESIYVTYNSSTNKLYFRDGSFWVLGCTSATSEADSGTMYPTTMEDTNGNQVIVTYQPGAGLGGTNTSARISQILDVRGSYLFTYNSDTPHHLTSITNGMQTPETYTFQYGTLSLQAPFSPYTTYGTVAVLSTVELTANSQVYTFTYTSDNSGALQSSTLPNGGVLTWSYQNVTYGNGGTYREILQRQLSKDGVNYTNYPFTFPSPGYNTNLSAVIDDPGGVGEKFWAFSQTGVNAGMVTQYQGRQLPGPVTKTQNDFTWTQDNVGNLYIGSTLTTLDPGQSYQAQKRTDQTVDVHGNVLNVFQYDYNSLSAPSRVYTYTYLNTTAYTSRYIYNRLTQATLGIGSQNVITLATNSYDATFSTAPTGVTNWDTSYASVTARGDVTSYISGSDSGSTAYDATGNATSATLNGVATQVTTTSATNYAAPSQLSVGGLTTSLDWTSALGMSSATGPNGDSSSMTYANGIPATSTSTFGAVTTYVYPTGPNGPSNLPIPKATTNGRWTKTTLDGLGRTISIQTGNASGAISQTDTVYGSCGCSPTGKMIQQSLPHAPTAGAVWTTYTYDGIGRTLNVLAPDGASTTTYLYLGNTVKVTDPAGKWKIFTMDAFGHLTQVDEPNPGSGSTPPQPASPPSFSPAPGGYSTSQTVTLSTSTSGASIRYTTNGTMPSETVGTLYSGTIAVSSSTTINAIAYASGMADSAISDATYTIGSGGSGAPWYNSAWTYRKPITIAHGQISGSSILTNFPVLISETDSNLAASAQSNGYDILFTASDGLTKLSHEIETYTSSTGLLNAWVSVPSLSPTTDTVIYMYFGNPSAPNQQHATGAWDSNYVGVWHLPNGSTLSPNDSTVNANNGTNSGAGAVPGEIGGAASFNGTSSDISVGNSSTEQINGTVTISAWVTVAAFQPANTNNWAYVLGKGYDGTREGYYLRLNAQNSSVVQLNAGSFSGSTNFNVLWPIAGWTTNTWHHIVGTYDGTNWNVYFDGALKASSTQAIGAVPTGLGTYLGVQNINGTLQRFWNGDLDEVRLSNTARSAGWIATEYNNQANPSTFYAYGALQTQTMSSGGYQFSRQITLNAATYNPAAQSNFTVLICANSSSGACNASVTGLNQSGSGPHVQNANGYDIVFSSTSCASPTLMKWEMENYVASTGEMEAWVLVPSLGTTNQTIYLCYGNTGISAFQGGGLGTAWDGNYKGIWHLSNGSTLSAKDSSASADNGTINGATATAGKIGGGAAMSFAINYITTAGVAVTGNITIEGWMFPTSSSDYNAILAHGANPNSDYNFYTSIGSTSSMYVVLGDSTAPGTVSVSPGWTLNAWNHFVMSADGTTVRIYINGALAGSATNSHQPVGNTATTYLGGDAENDTLNGSLDEVRLSSSIRSANWITTEYNNQNSPSSFSTIAAEQTVGGGGGGYLTPVGMPTFSPAPGTYSSSQTVTLTTSTTGASIRYTTNGTTPSETAGALYSGPITVPNTTTIKAIAYESGMADSEISTATYTISGSSGGGDYLTYYTYDGWDNVSQVFMPRSSGTQIRTFTYNAKLLLSATNPENGTVTYTYNSYNKVAKKTDAKGQAVVYTYDSIARLTKVQRYPTGTSGSEDTCQQENYYYDSNPFTSGYSQYALGRLAAIQYYAPSSGIAGNGCGTTFVEQYSYNQAGAKIKKGELVTRSLQSPTTTTPYTVDLESSYTYDTEGRMLTVQYPGSTGGSAGPNLGYAYDTMGRLNTLTDLATTTSLISATTYDPANRLSSITGSVYNESRSYNGMGQLTGLTSNSVSMTYNYSATQNNGKITGQTDNVSGEQVVYAYDALNRLASAASTTSSWGQSYGYDGFGNLTDQTVTAGSAPSLHVVYNASNNRQTTDCADANGNVNSTTNCSGGYGFDVENRIVAVSGNSAYAYAPGNKRVWRGTTSASHLTLDELTFWSITGQKLATYTIQGGDPTVVYNPPSMGVVLATSNYYFGRKLIKNGNGYVGSDRLGSVGKFYPYGQEKPSATTNGTEKFTGYFRDAETGNDYAKNRYHQPGMGRFLSPDPYTALSTGASNPNDPGSWNRYSYVGGDPVNGIDPAGLEECNPERYCPPGDPGTGPVGWEPGPPCTAAVPVGEPHPECAGGPGGGRPSSPPKVNNKSQARAALGYELNHLGANCQKVLPSIGTLTSDASDLTFWDATSADGSLLVNSLPGAVGPGTLSSAVGYDNAVTLNGPSGTISSQVVLGAGFFNKDASLQGIILLHELLHYALQEIDKPIDIQFGITGQVGDTSSSAFTAWLNNDCQNPSN